MHVLTNSSFNSADIYFESRNRTYMISQQVRTKKSRFAFFEPPWGGLGATYDDHLRLIEKRVVDFLFVLIELFSLGVTAEALQANID